MSSVTPQSGTGFRTWYKRQSRVGRISFILTAAIIFMLLVGHLWHFAELLFIAPIILCIIVLSPLLIVLLHRWITQRLLWKVRNRLIVTYALMSLAPVVLCLTLFSIASYIFGGQFATNSTLTQLDQASTEVSDETISATLVSLASNGRMLATQHSSRLGTILPISLAVVKYGIFRPMTETAPDTARNPFIGQPVPAWLFSGFRGLVLFNDQLYLVAFTKLSQGGQTVTVLGSQPLNVDALNDIAEDLGRVVLMPGFSLAVNGSADNVDASDDDASQNAAERNFSKLDAGTLPPRAHFFDAPVVFSAPTSVLSWQNGHDLHGIVTVFSRPSTLYTRLFASTNGLGTYVRIILICIAIFFALLELFALLMAAGLSRTITRSVADLYKGTTEIDRGNLAHRIRVVRRDQLGALATSFNSMAASIEDLLQQQREKDRLLNELAIAQEVQTNLYPRSPVSFAQLEMHGVCMPARTVSGDYFDFIFEQGRGRGLCLAFGDISGKGISAAMLMASLHSAVRAFSLNTEEDTIAPPSPALLLELLNRHLYRSTAPEKYATLFLAYYDVASRRLTYSNGGHLPPLVISTDGRVQALDCGGPVVGLLNDLEYEEATIVLQPGDLMMAFTDGLTEPENETGEFGEQRLLDYVRVNKDEPLPELVAGALKTVQAWVGNQEQSDDMTLLLVRQI